MAHTRNLRITLAALLLVLALPISALAQAVINGVTTTPVYPGAEKSVPLTNILSIGSLTGSQAQACVERSKWDVMAWEKVPHGWFSLSNVAGNYTLAFTNPGHFIRPTILTNVYVADGEELRLNVTPKLDYANFDESDKDPKPATDYYQLFTAKGTSLTQIGFKPIWEPSGGETEADKDILISILRKGDGTPDTWEQIGSTQPALFKSLNNIPVKDAGARNYPYSVGWNSGEIPLRPGEVYAVHFSLRSPECTFQTFWRPNTGVRDDCYRIGADGSKGWTGKSIWMAVSTDNDGLVIPYNKRIHREPNRSSKWTQKWSQTYIAQGRSLASVVLYASGTTEQLSINLQRLIVRVREGGPDGPVVGIEKIAKGSGEWTGDSTWGIFAAAYAPGEVPLVPGKMYAIEFETGENFYTLDNYINIKRVPSASVGGFNPARKMDGDDYLPGRAYQDGKTPTDFDLDMQVVEYKAAARDWAEAEDSADLLKNGDIQRHSVYIVTEEQSRAYDWKKFKIHPDTILEATADGQYPSNFVLRVIGGGKTGKKADGGFIQRVTGLSDKETYRLSGQVRSTWAADSVRQCMVGYDPTGQTSDPKADTIVWKVLPSVNGVFVDYESEPIRPRTHSISVWLRGRLTYEFASPIGLPGRDPWEFWADFDNFSLRRINTGIPGEEPVTNAKVAPEGVDPDAYLAVSQRADDLIARLPGRPVMSGKGMPTKLGLLYLMGNSESQGMLDLADAGLVPIIKTGSQSGDRGWRVIEHKPDAVWIVSGHIDMNADSQTPEQAADSSYNMVVAGLKNVPKEWQARVDFVELTQCMWEPKTPEQGIWYSQFLCELLPRIAELGPRPIVLNSGVGGLPIEPDVLAAMAPGLRLAKHTGGAWGCHGYTIKYSKDEDLESYYSLRYRRAYDYFKRYQPELADFPMILLEGGVDDKGDPDKDGWLARGSLDKYTDWLAWYDKQLMRDDYVLGVTLFKIGAPSIWKSFELEPVVPWLFKHYRAAYKPAK